MSSKDHVIEIVNEWEDRLPLGTVASLHKGDTNPVGEDDTGAAAPSRHAVEST